MAGSATGVVGDGGKALILLDALGLPVSPIVRGVDRAVANAAVRVVGLVKLFGKGEALAGVDREVAPGAACGLVGANGAGKTTLLKCMLDLCAFEVGRIEIFGVTSGAARARARLAYVPERFLPPHYLRGREFLELTLRLGGVAHDEAAARAPRFLPAAGAPGARGADERPRSGEPPGGEVRPRSPARRGAHAAVHLARARRRGGAVHGHRRARARPRALSRRAGRVVRALRRHKTRARIPA